MLIGIATQLGHHDDPPEARLEQQSQLPSQCSFFACDGKGPQTIKCLQVGSIFASVNFGGDVCEFRASECEGYRFAPLHLACIAVANVSPATAAGVPQRRDTSFWPWDLLDSDAFAGGKQITRRFAVTSYFRCFWLPLDERSSRCRHEACTRSAGDSDACCTAAHSMTSLNAKNTVVKLTSHLCEFLSTTCM